MPIITWESGTGFRILMVGEKVHVFLNGELVVNNVTMENYWERDKPIYPFGANRIAEPRQHPLVQKRLCP